MRTVRIDEPDKDHPWAWLAAGAALGIVAGVLVARRMDGTKATPVAPGGRGRRLMTVLLDNIGPIVAAVTGDDGDEDEEEEDDDELEPMAEGEDDDEEESDEEDEEVEEDEAVADDALDARVLEAFSNDPVLAERDVEIESDREGSIVLHGRVRSAKEAKHAVTIARGVPGVARVRERLTVRARPR